MKNTMQRYGVKIQIASNLTFFLSTLRFFAKIGDEYAIFGLQSIRF
jgi:hypothetical protein